MATRELEPLFVVTQPEPDESSFGFLVRCAEANHILSHARPRTYGAQYYSQKEATRGTATLAWLTHCDPAWLRWRSIVNHKTDGRKTMSMFGQPWRFAWSHRRDRHHICSDCLREYRRALFVWDLSFVCACPRHGTILQDSCHRCGQAIGPQRPALDICRCRHFLAPASTKGSLATDVLLSWCTWVEQTLVPDNVSAPTWPRSLSDLFDGMTVEGAALVTLAFSGGVMALRSARMQTSEPWLTSATMAYQLAGGLQKLLSYLESGASGAYLPPSSLRDLEDLASNGLVVHDRQRASWLVKRLHSRKLRPTVIAALNRQQDLFDV